LKTTAINWKTTGTKFYFSLASTKNPPRNQLLDYLAKDDNNDVILILRRIISHNRPITGKHSNYKGSTNNIMIKWENGETTMEPLQIIAKYDPVTFTVFAKDKGLLDAFGWK
jgi:hypothetical protein